MFHVSVKFLQGLRHKADQTFTLVFKIQFASLCSETGFISLPICSFFPSHYLPVPLSQKACSHWPSSFGKSGSDIIEQTMELGSRFGIMSFRPCDRVGRFVALLSSRSFSGMFGCVSPCLMAPNAHLGCTFQGSSTHSRLSSTRGLRNEAVYKNPVAKMPQSLASLASFNCFLTPENESVPVCIGRTWASIFPQSHQLRGAGARVDATLLTPQSSLNSLPYFSASGCSAGHVCVIATAALSRIYT